MEPTTSGIRCWTASRRPDRADGARASRNSPGRPSPRDLPRIAPRRDPPTLASVREAAALQLLGRGRLRRGAGGRDRQGRLSRGRSVQGTARPASHVLAAADAVLAKSGTTTLEAALADVPMVVAYSVNPITAWLVRPHDDVALGHPGQPDRGARGRAGTPARSDDADRHSSNALRPLLDRGFDRAHDGNAKAWPRCDGAWGTRSERAGGRDRSGTARRVNWRLPGGVVREPVAPLVGALSRSWRFRVRHAEHWHALQATGTPFVFLLWHEALLPLLWLHRHQQVAIVVSEAREGRYLADYASAIGYRRSGSSTRGGARALLGAVRALREGDRRWPYAGRTARAEAGDEAGRGAGGAACRGGDPAAARARPAAWRFGSWDRMMVPQAVRPGRGRLWREFSVGAWRRWPWLRASPDAPRRSRHWRGRWAAMSRRGDAHRFVRWLWTSRQAARAAPGPCCFPASGLWSLGMAVRRSLYRHRWVATAGNCRCQVSPSAT